VSLTSKKPPDPAPPDPALSDTAPSDPGAPVRRVCVFAQLNGPGLGDMVQRNIMLAQARRGYPAARITLVVGRSLAARFADLLDGHLYADDVLCCPDPADPDEEHWQAFLAELTARDYQVCLIDPGSAALDAAHAAAAGIGTRIGMRLGRRSDAYITRPVRLPPPLLGFPDLYEHAAAFAAAMGSTEPLRGSDVVPPLPMRRVPVPELAAPGPRIAVHATGMALWNRRWPLASFGELGGRLTQRLGASLFLLGTAAELTELGLLRDMVREHCPEAVVHLEADSALNRTANLLAGVDLLIGNDSALLHIAAAVGTPAVVIIGPTATELLWARVYPRHRGVSLSYPCQAITHDVDQVAGRVCEHHCLVPYQGPAGPYPRCMTDLSVDQVQAAVLAQLSAYPSNVSGISHVS
jgi:ADP-heptose:LPS heptosyltransferase